MAIEHFYTKAELATLSKRERNQYEAALRNHWDNLADKETTRIRMKQAREEGRTKGLAEGEKETTLDCARKMRSLGLATEVIAASTGLTEEEINLLM